MDSVVSGPEEVLESDHRPVLVQMLSITGRAQKYFRKTLMHNRCGKWKVDMGKAILSCNALAEQLELSASDFDLEQLHVISEQVSQRATSCRYRDPPEIRNLIATRRELAGREAREKAKEVLQLRKVAKAAWLQELLDKAASGNFFAVSYLLLQVTPEA